MVLKTSSFWCAGFFVTRGGCVALESQAAFRSDVKLHAECKWDWQRLVLGTAIRGFL